MKIKLERIECEWCEGIGHTLTLCKVCSGTGLDPDRFIIQRETVEKVVDLVEDAIFHAPNYPGDAINELKEALSLLLKDDAK